MDPITTALMTIFLSMASIGGLVATVSAVLFEHKAIATVMALFTTYILIITTIHITV